MKNKRSRKTFKKRIINFLILLILLMGIGVAAYPFFSNWYNQRIQDGLIEELNIAVEEISEEEKEAEFAACEEYNKTLLGNVVLTDPFDPDKEVMPAEAYEERLNINNNSIMGYIEIPGIDVNLNIYHTTSAEVLDKGVGHLENTSLPVGGDTTHAVLSAHTAYAKATFFNDLIRVEDGDVFYLTILGEKLAYQVDQIKVVEPTRTKDLGIVAGEDYVTLITCTPYGVNSHRLLVRGTRIPYIEMMETEAAPPYFPYALLVAAFFFGLRFFLFSVRRRQKRGVCYEN